MPNATDWIDLGPTAAFEEKPITEVVLKDGKIKIAVSHRDGQFGAVSGVCNHVGGPLGKGHLDGDYVVCPWHAWKFHRKTGFGEPGFEDDRVPGYEVKVENGHLFVSAQPVTTRNKLPHPAHPLARKIERQPGPTRVVGISTTVMDYQNPRYSTSEALLDLSLEEAKSKGCETKLIRLGELKFRSCEGYYSKHAEACTWPCSITQMDDKDELTVVYDALVHWADVLILSTSIRWGQASSLFFKLAERLNCVQNQVTIRNRVLIRNKVGTFIVTGGQDNIQGVAGNLLCFFSELGFQFPQFPFIAHSLGWASEDMERNISYVMQSEELREGARDLARRGIDKAKLLLEHTQAREKTERGGRKAHHLEVKETL